MTNSPWPRLAMIFVVGLVAMEGILAWQLHSQVRAGHPDFRIFYTAGSIVREGAGHALYDLELQRSIQSEFVTGDETQNFLPFNHPAFEALLFLPLAHLSYFEAYLAWAAVNVFLVALVVALLRRHLVLMQGVSGFLWVLAGLAFFPLFIALLQGQDSILLLTTVVLAYIALRTGRYFAAGCWLGLGLIRFHLILPMILILALHRRFKLVAGFFFVGLAMGMISIGVVGIHQALSYSEWLLRLESAMGNSAALVAAMPNLRGFLATISSGSGVTTLWRMTLVVAAIVLLVWTALKCHFSGSRRDMDLSLSLVLVMTVVSGYHVLPHDLSLLFLALLLVGDWLWARRPSVAPENSEKRFSSLHSTANARSLGVGDGDIVGVPTAGRNRWVLGAVILPPCVLCVGPIQMLLWLRGRHFGLLAPILLLWMWGIGQLISKRGQTFLAPLKE